MNLKTTLRRGFNRLGFDVSRLSKSPNYTFLGLRDLRFGTVIDVGANRGQFARLASEFFPNAKFYCFEPLGEPFRELTAWAKTQNGRVHCFQLALGEQEGQVDMHMHEQHLSSSSILAATDNCHQLYPKTRTERRISVKVSTLDRVLEDVLDKLPREIFLKLDVQGFEDRVLRGGAKLFPNCRAILLEISLDTLYEGQADFLHITQLMYQNGFRYAGNLNQVYGDNGHVAYLDALFRKEDNASN